MNFNYQVYSGSLNKSGEPVCGNLVFSRDGPDGTAAAVVDGGGYGIRANIAATYVMRMFTSMLERGAPVLSAFRSVVGSIPTQEEESGFASISALQAGRNGEARLACCRMPPALLLRRGKLVEFVPEERNAEGGSVSEFRATLKNGDMVVLYTAGLVSRNGGLFTGTELSAFLKAAYRPGITAEKMATLLLNVGGTIAGGKPRDDITVLAVRAEKPPGP